MGKDRTITGVDMACKNGEYIAVRFTPKQWKRFESLQTELKEKQAKIDKVLAIGPHTVQEDDLPAVILRKESSNELLEITQDIFRNNSAGD